MSWGRGTDFNGSIGARISAFTRPVRGMKSPTDEFCLRREEAVGVFDSSSMRERLMGGLLGGDACSMNVTCLLLSRSPFIVDMWLTQKGRVGASRGVKGMAPRKVPGRSTGGARAHAYPLLNPQCTTHSLEHV